MKWKRNLPLLWVRQVVKRLSFLLLRIASNHAPEILWLPPGIHSKQMHCLFTVQEHLLSAAILHQLPYHACRTDCF
jgi:hypothetical protein